jgi:hypothetical protein
MPGLNSGGQPSGINLQLKKHEKMPLRVAKDIHANSLFKARQVPASNYRIPQEAINL